MEGHGATLPLRLPAPVSERATNAHHLRSESQVSDRQHYERFITYVAVLKDNLREGSEEIARQAKGGGNQHDWARSTPRKLSAPEQRRLMI